MLSKLLMVHTPLALRKWRLVDSTRDLIVQEHRCPAGRDSCYLCCFQKASHPPLDTNHPLPTSRALENSGSENLEPIWGKTKMEGHQEKSTGEVGSPLRLLLRSPLGSPKSLAKMRGEHLSRNCRVEGHVRCPWFWPAKGYDSSYAQRPEHQEEVGGGGWGSGEVGVV